MKKYILWIITGLIVLLFPIVLNWLIMMPSFFNFVGEGVDWLNFWITYLSAIASFAMVFITWRTLKQNTEQLSTMKKQWGFEHQPQIELYFVKGDNYIVDGTTCGIAEKLVLEIVNIGHSIAKDISFTIQVDDAIANIEAKESIVKIGQRDNFMLFPNEAYRIPLCYTEIDRNSQGVYKYKIGSVEVPYGEWLDFPKKLKCINVLGTYSDTNRNTYNINTKVDPLIIKNRHYSSEEVLLRVEEAIKQLNYTQHNDRKEQ